MQTPAMWAHADFGTRALTELVLQHSLSLLQLYDLGHKLRLHQLVLPRQICQEQAKGVSRKGESKGGGRLEQSSPTCRNVLRIFCALAQLLTLRLHLRLQRVRLVRRAPRLFSSLGWWREEEEKGKNQMRVAGWRD